MPRDLGFSVLHAKTNKATAFAMKSHLSFDLVSFIPYLIAPSIGLEALAYILFGILPAK